MAPDEPRCGLGFRYFSVEGRLGEFGTKKSHFYEGFGIFSVEGRLGWFGTKKYVFLQGLDFFFLSKDALEGLAGPLAPWEPWGKPIASC